MGAILKINILSIISLPLLLASVVVKLIQKTVERVPVLFRVFVVITMTSILNSMFKSTNYFFGQLADLFELGIFSVGIFMLVLGVIVIKFTLAVLVSCIDILFMKIYGGYLRLYDICSRDFGLIVQNEGSGNLRFGCVFWYFVRIIHRIIAGVFSAALVISIVLSVGFVGYSIFYVNKNVSEIFAIDLISYIKLFPPIEIIFTIINFVVVVASVVTVLISLGAEWNKWGVDLRLASMGGESGYGDFLKGSNVGNYTNEQQCMTVLISLGAEWNKWGVDLRLASMGGESGYGDFLKGSNVGNYTNEQQCSFEDGKLKEQCEQSMEIFYELSNGLEVLDQQVKAALDVQYSSSLNYSFSEYVNLLSKICKKMESFKGNIPCGKFKSNLIPMISMAQKKARDIELEIFSIFQKNSTSAGNTVAVVDFFGGCTTDDELHKRYRALCKVYHPDVGGHEDTFKQLQEQYEKKRSKVSE